MFIVTGIRSFSVEEKVLNDYCPVEKSPGSYSRTRERLVSPGSSVWLVPVPTMPQLKRKSELIQKAFYPLETS